MRAYSTDLKERLVRAVADGQPMREAARRYNVAVTTVKRAVVQQRETGSLERKPIPGISAEILFARNAEIKVVAPSLGDTVVENVLSPPEVPSAQESHRAPDSRHGPARDADHGDRPPAADQPTNRT
jgi:transposase-like protein